MILLGNSSSGIHEASTFKVPVINIGSRQDGREKPKNIIDVNYDKNEILRAIKKLQARPLIIKLGISKIPMEMENHLEEL